MTQYRYAGIPTLLAVLAASLLLSSAGLAQATTRGPGGQRRHPTEPSPLGGSFVIVKTSNANALAQCLLGPSLVVTNATLTAAAAATGAFSNGSGVVGLTAGAVFGTGDIDSLARPNQFDDLSYDNFQPGDADMNALLDPTATVTTFDAAVLNIDFTVAIAGTLNLSYVFGSEEYNEFVDQQFNDLFALFLDGNDIAHNIAVTGGGCATQPGLKIAVNSVNCGTDGATPAAPNCPCYRDNTGATIGTELDGLTRVFTASAPLTVGPHHLKVAIADAADPIYDAAVFIQCQSGGVPVRQSTWGRVKATYR